MLSISPIRDSTLKWHLFLFVIVKRDASERLGNLEAGTMIASSEALPFLRQPIGQQSGQRLSSQLLCCFCEKRYTCQRQRKSRRHDTGSGWCQLSRHSRLEQDNKFGQNAPLLHNVFFSLTLTHSVPHENFSSHQSSEWSQVVNTAPARAKTG